MMGKFFSERKFPISLAVLIMLAGAFFYFTYAEAEMSTNAAIYKDIELKTAFSPEGQLKIFALAKNNQLAQISPIDGNSIPETDSMVIGFAEAEMMKKEKLFNKSGDKINGLFGINTEIGGILQNTDSLLDDFHFLSNEQFKELNGENGKAFVKLKDEKEPKLFYSYRYGENLPNLKLKEGNFGNYQDTPEIVGEKYYPVILGSKEAKMMKQEELFSKPGDIIKGFFGKNIIIIGIAEETNTSLDMMHIIPLNEGDFE